MFIAGAPTELVQESIVFCFVSSCCVDSCGEVFPRVEVGSNMNTSFPRRALWYAVDALSCKAVDALNRKNSP